MRNRVNVASRSRSQISENTVLKNTYMLLGMTFCFSGIMALVSLMMNAGPMNPLLWLAVMFGLQYATVANSQTAWGIPMIFAFTGFMGYSIGPIIALYLGAYSNGSELVFTSLGATGVIFFALSGYVIANGKDYSYMGGMLFVAILVAFMAGIGAMLFNMPMLSIVVSGAFALISSGLILFHTSEIVHGGERNYILATMSIFIAIYNLFLSLLRILAFFAGNRD